ncbi:MAG: ABC transporter ATP-binding protein [Nitriliruptoraceae bacterium]
MIRAHTSVPDPQLMLEQVGVRYGDTVAIDDLDLVVNRGEIMSIVGPSGCGKSSLVRVIAGLVGPYRGRVTIAGAVVADERTWVPPEKRGVGVVFQEYALFPHLRLGDNVGFGLPGGDASRRRVAEVLELVNLAPLADRYPHELSGGEQQRAALARALAPRPQVLLLDEPFSNLDRNLRDQVRHDTVAAMQEEGVTAICVTHDRAEALVVGSRVAVMRDGRLEQVDTPEAVYHAPANRFVAAFLDDADLVAGTAADGVAETRFGRLPIQPDSMTGPVEVMIRPHEVTIHPDEDGDGFVDLVEFRGGSIAHRVRLADGSTVLALRRRTDALALGTRVRVEVVVEHPLTAFVRDDTVPMPMTSAS